MYHPSPALALDLVMEEERHSFIKTSEPKSKLGFGRQSKTKSKLGVLVIGALAMLVAVPLLHLHNVLAPFDLNLHTTSASAQDKTKTQKNDVTASDASWTDPCTFYERGTGPLPVILMALGRTGSSITWSTMSALTGERNIAWEETGGNTNSSAKFFESLESNQLAFHNWTIQRLCHIQQRRSDVSINAGIAGFQWKPYMNTFRSEYATEGIKAIGKSVDPMVKVVYLTRNPLDRRISNLRHGLSKQAHEELPAHCEAGNVECKKRFSAVESGVTLPIGRELIHWLNTDAKNIEEIKATLEEAGVDYVHVSYEKLFNADNADEWKNIFRFLGVGPTEDLTMDDVKASFDLASTHSKGRNETVSNFKEVENTLKGTKFEHLLFE